MESGKSMPRTERGGEWFRTILLYARVHRAVAGGNNDWRRNEGNVLILLGGSGLGAPAARGNGDAADAAEATG